MSNKDIPLPCDIGITDPPPRQCGTLCGYPLFYPDTVTSTNTYIKNNIGAFPDKAVVIGDMQTAGRGRQGNIWVAARDMLALSVLYKNPVDPTRMTIICGVAVCRAAAAMLPADIRTGIKWTNDIICENSKVCGILCESTVKCSENGAAFYACTVCGIGVNINQSEDFFKTAGLTDAASFYTLSKKKYDKLTAAAMIVSEMNGLLKEDFSAVISEYKSRCLTTGKKVRLMYRDKEVYALAKDIGENGELICENENGVFTVTAGEVRVRTENGKYI